MDMQHSSKTRMCSLWWNVIRVGLILIGVRNEILLRSLNPKDREREFHPCVNLHRERLLPLRQSSVKLKSVSCKPNLLARTCDFRKCTKFALMSTSSLQGFLQTQSLETILVSIVVRCFPHNNIACIHLGDECMRSYVRVLLVIARANLFTHHKISVYQCGPSTSVLQLFVSKLYDSFSSFKWMVIHVCRCDFVKM